MIRLTYQRYFSAVLYLFVLLSFVTVSGAWVPRNAYAAAEDTGGADLVRQIVYVAFAAAALAPIFKRSFHRMVRSIPPSLWLLFIWCAITLTWSPVPSIGLRRLLLTLVISFCCLATTMQLSPGDALRTIWRGLALLVLLSLATAVLVPSLGVHQPGDPEALVVGDWRGIFYHKNILGSVASLSALISLHFATQRTSSRAERRTRWQARCVFVVAIFLLVMSRSKTSLGMVLLCGSLYFILAAFRSRSRKLIVYSVALAIFLAALALIFLPVLGVSLEFIFLNPAAFTGRGFIWDMLLEAVKKKSLGGIGYQSVFQVGNASALVGMTRNSFYDTLAHAHNAYLEIYVSIGLVGLLLALLVIVVLPIRQVYRMGPQFSDVRPVLFTTLAFVYMHDILESGLLDRDRPTWLMLLMVYGIARAATMKDSVHLPRTSSTEQGGRHCWAEAN